MSFLDRLLGRDSKPDDDTFGRLREQVLSVTPEQLGLAPTATRPNVWGALMEWPIGDDIAMLVTLADGTVSLYLSSGGGVIGAGMHEPVRAEAERFLDAAEAHRAHLAATRSVPLPRSGIVRFHARTFVGEWSAEVSEDALVDGTHVLAPLFQQAQEVLTAVREATSERERPVPPGPAAGTSMVLEVAAPPDHVERVVASDPDAGTIVRTVRGLAWDTITYVILKADDDHWIEGSGSLDPTDGLSARVTIGGETWVSSRPLQSLDEMLWLLLSWRKGDDEWRTRMSWE